MRLIHLSLVAALLLAGCDNEPKLDASDLPHWQASLAAVRAKLSDADQKTFGQALVTLALTDVGSSGDQNLGGALAQLSLLANPDNLLVQLRPLVDGKTGAEVIKLGQERQVAIYNRQLEAIDGKMTALRDELSRDEQSFSGARAILSNVTLAKPLYYWSKSDFLDQPTIDFEITNSSGVAIAAISVEGILETPGRSVPWVRDKFRYSFKGGLENGETQHLQLAPNMFGEWGDQQLKDRQDLVLTLNLVSIEDANGQKIPASDSSELERKRNQLADMEKTKADLKEKLRTAGVVVN